MPSAPALALPRKEKVDEETGNMFTNIKGGSRLDRHPRLQKLVGVKEAAISIYNIYIKPHSQTQLRFTPKPLLTIVCLFVSLLNV